MAVGVKIRKYRQSMNEYFYKLYSLDWQEVVLYMKIEPLKNKVSYSTCADFTHVESEIDLLTENMIVKSIPNIRYIIITRSLMRAMDAIRANQFPESMDYCS